MEMVIRIQFCTDKINDIMLNNSIFILLLLFTISCENQVKIDILTIKGNMENLPDGKLYLKEFGVKMDSTNTKNGKFVFEIPKEEDFEPKYIQFTHIAFSDSIVRIFMFDTKAKYKSKTLNSDQMMLEENFPELIGKLEDSKIGDKLMSSKFKSKVAFGTQTKVFFEDTIRLPAFYTTKHLNEMLNKYPYSYRVLYEFERFAPAMSDKQALSFFLRFDSKLRNGSSGKRVETYIKSRSTKRLTETLLPDLNNIQRKILLPSKRIHLVILWASWCGPCRREIPDLKRIFQKFKNQESFDMVSISYDEKYQKWKTALEDEKMPWRQLIIDKEIDVYSKELFQFDGSIPTTLLIDSSGKIIKKYVRHDKENEAEIVKLIASYDGKT